MGNTESNEKEDTVKILKDVYGLSFASGATPLEFLQWLSSNGKQFRLLAVDGIATGKYLGGYWMGGGQTWWTVIYKDPDIYTLGQYESRSNRFPLFNKTLNHYLTWNGFRNWLESANGAWYIDFIYNSSNNTWRMKDFHQANSFFGAVAGGAEIDWQVNSNPISFKIQVVSSVNDDERTKYAKYLEMDPSLAACRNGLEVNSYCRVCLDPANTTNPNCIEGFKKSCRPDNLFGDSDCSKTCIDGASNPTIRELCHNGLGGDSTTNKCYNINNLLNNDLCKAIYSKNFRDYISDSMWKTCENNDNNECQCINPVVRKSKYEEYMKQQATKIIDASLKPYDDEINNPERTQEQKDALLAMKNQRRIQLLGIAANHLMARDTAGMVVPEACIIPPCKNNDLYTLSSIKCPDVVTNIAICEQNIDLKLAGESSINRSKLEQNCNISITNDIQKIIGGKPSPGDEPGDEPEDESSKSKNSLLPWILGISGGGFILLILIIIIILIIVMAMR